MRILCLNRYYPPDDAPTGRLLAEIVEELERRGHACDVVAGRPGYGSRGYSTAEKLWGYLAYAARAAWRTWTGPRPDVVLTMTTPPLLGLLGWSAQRWRGSRHVIWEMDVYPDVAVALGTFRPGGVFARVVGWLADAPRRRADAVIALGRCMRELLERRGARGVVVCENWSADVGMGAMPGFAEGVQVVYSGNLGLAHEFGTVRSAMAAGLRATVRFVGRGPRAGEVATVAAPVGWEDYGALLAGCHAGLVTQRAETVGTVVPSKAYAYWSAGRPVVFVGPREGEIARVIAERGCGWVVAVGDVAGLRGVVAGMTAESVRVAGERARAVWAERYTRERGVARVCGVVEGVGG